MIMHRYLMILPFLFVSYAGAGELTIPDDKNIIEFETKLGTVTFAHRMHADLSITECTTCHHKHEPGETVMKPCHQCHQHKADKSADANAPAETKTAFHNRCTGCHEYTVAGGHQAGPLKKKCRLCHVKPAE